MFRHVLSPPPPFRVQVEYLNACRGNSRGFEASASRGGVVRGTLRPLCWICKLSSNSPPLHAAGCSGTSPPLAPALQSLVDCLGFMPDENTKEAPACRPTPSGSASNAINGDGLNRRVTSGPRIPPGEITRCVLSLSTRRIVSSRGTSSGSKCLDSIIYVRLYLCTLLPRPLLSSQKSVLCLTRKFVSSWKNPFGSK